MSENKLAISYELAMLDTKNRDFYDSLTDEEKNKYSNLFKIFV